MRTYRIVVGVDGSDGGVRALRWALQQARVRGGAVRAVMTYDWTGTEAAYLAGLGADGERVRAEALLDGIVDDVRREYAEVPVSSEVLLGQAGHKLAEAAKAADLLVVGSHGHSRLHHAVMGSVSEACVRHATCPVVIVPVPVMQVEAVVRSKEAVLPRSA